MSIDLLVIGGGPAGLMCAITAVQNGSLCDQGKLSGQSGTHDFDCDHSNMSHGDNFLKKIVVLEKNDQTAKKLLIAGSGRCNITHVGPISDFLQCYGEHGQFVKPALFNWTNDDLADFMKSRSLPLVELNDGKLFPVTQSSRDVRQVLLDELKKCQVEIRYLSTVEQIEKDGDTFVVRVKQDGESSHDYTEATLKFPKLHPSNAVTQGVLLKQSTTPLPAPVFAKKVVIATGGKTYPTTGSTGDGYRLAKMLGHTVTETAPALTPVMVKNYRFAECAGLSFEAITVKALRNEKKIAQTKGDLLLTHHGLSGPVILDLSRNILPNDTLEFSFVPTFPNAAAFERQLIDDCTAGGKKGIKNLIAQQYGLPDRLVAQLFLHNNIPFELTAATLDRETRKQIVSLLAEARFVVEKLGGDHEAMVTRGGVSLHEVDRNSMQSRLVPGLFFCGEVLDVDGKSGGYNLQFAFSSGVLAGKHKT